MQRFERFIPGSEIPIFEGFTPEPIVESRVMEEQINNIMDIPYALTPHDRLVKLSEMV